MVQSSSRLRAFLTCTPLQSMLERCWRTEGYYFEPSSNREASPGLSHYFVSYHTYLALLGIEVAGNTQRVVALACRLIDDVQPSGVLLEPDGTLNDHPAAACHVADALGTFCHYGARLGCDPAILAQAREALVRIVENHPVVRLPEGVIGRTQQLRFELRAYYWAWRVTGDSKYKDACFKLWANGLNAYQNPMASSGVFYQASLHPDFTWNYACSAGTTTEYATNTHTPVYYCTEPQGFGFVYLHGLKEGVLEPNSQWHEFCRKYFLGLLRNLSRAGHTASDLDGYGVHRAWYVGCLLETAPVEAAGLGPLVGLSEQAGWFRWLVERFVDFIERSPAFESTATPEQCPYGHHITIEKQFPALMGARFYSHLARAIYEYGLDEIEPIEPPPLLHYAWWHNWVRLSTRTYETSFVGTTSLCRLPVVKYFGDPNLGCLHGGAPLSTLMVRNRLLYATSNDPAGLWHVELTDTAGNVWRSCASSFNDTIDMTVKSPEGRLLNRDCFQSHEAPVMLQVADKAADVFWSKTIAAQGVRFFVQNAYTQHDFASRWGALFPPGNYIADARFILPIPVRLNPEWKWSGTWETISAGVARDGWPEALRWSDGKATAEVSLSHFKGEGTSSIQAVPIALRTPGGENSFCPFELVQVRLNARITSQLDGITMHTQFVFPG